jgi:hypothetical protein
MLFNNTVNTLAQESWLTFACETLTGIETEATQREDGWLLGLDHAGTPERLTSLIIAA